VTDVVICADAMRNGPGTQPPEGYTRLVSARVSEGEGGRIIAPV
jgi:hypothetical protein